MSYPFKLRYFYLHEGNRSRARNLGAQEAQSDRLVFLDADIALPTDWFQQLDFYWTGSVDVIQGSIIPSSQVNNHLQRLRLWRGMNAAVIPFLLFTHPLVKKRVINSSCFGIDRKLFHQNEGFDLTFTRHEDLDFTQRLIRHPCRIRIVQKLRVQVFYSGSYFDYYKREFECGFHIVRFHEKWSNTCFSKAILSWMSHMLQLLKVSPERSKGFRRIENKFLLFTFLTGSLFGLFKKTIHPYSYPPNQFDEKKIKAQVELL